MFFDFLDLLCTRRNMNIKEETFLVTIGIIQNCHVLAINQFLRFFGGFYKKIF